MRLSFVALAAAAVLAPHLAHADQCAIVDSAVATRAVDLARHSRAVIDYCEPCGDKAPSTPVSIRKADIINGRVMINGHHVDLAYVYYQVAGDEYRNLGLEAGCSAQQVTRVIHDNHPVGVAPPLPPPPPPGPPFPPSRPPAVRISSFDDIAGNWTVEIRPRLSTCAVPGASRQESWSVAINGNEVTLITGTGGDMSGAKVPLASSNFLKAMLVDRREPDRGAVQIFQTFKDTFYADLLQVERNGGRRRHPCTTSYSVIARRAP